MPHILYSFRRCPYAMRARLAIAYSQQRVQLREIMLKEKPAHMLQLSSKGTVPVLQLSCGKVLDESLDIMVWAIAQNDPQQWLLAGQLQNMLALIDENDYEFKHWLDRYKYADRFPQYSESYYREQCEEFLLNLETRLSQQRYLFTEQISLADMAIFPFIRQFAGVDKAWFDGSGYLNVQRWLTELVNSALFQGIMRKYPTWLESEQQYLFPENETTH